MSRKPKHGYYIKGQFVAYGSELDQELNQRDVPSKSDLKRASEELQKLGQDLLDLRKDLLDKLNLPERFLDALRDAKRITNFEGKRRQMQYIGKLMRQLEEEDAGTIEAMRRAVASQSQGSAEETAQLHQLERLRDSLIASDGALTELLQQHPHIDVQHLRSLIRQARKTLSTASAQTHGGEDESARQGQEASIEHLSARPTDEQGAAPRKAKVYREIFQFLKALS